MFGWPNVLVAIVGALHALIATVEMFFWKKRKVHERLNFSDEEAIKVAPIVANAGLYNAFLAVALFWSTQPQFPGGVSVQMFLLTCVIIAGCFGAMTLKWTTLLLQSLPGAIALAAIWFSS